MTEHILTQQFELDGDTLSAARELAQRRFGARGVLWEHVLTEGSESVLAVAEEANEQELEERLPDGAAIVRRRIVQHNPTVEIREVSPTAVTDRESALNYIRQTLPANQRLVSLEVLRSGKRGFLGALSPNWRLRLEVAEKPVLEITYRTKPRIRVGVMPDAEHCLEVFRSEGPVGYGLLKKLAAAEHLAELGDSRVALLVPDLIQLLRDQLLRESPTDRNSKRDWEEDKRGIVRALARIRDTRAVAPLLRMLCAEGASVDAMALKGEVASALVGFSDPGILPALLEFIASHKTYLYYEMAQGHAERVVRRLLDTVPESRGELDAHLRHSNAAIRETAANFLATLGNAADRELYRAVEACERFLRTNQEGNAIGEDDVLHILEEMRESLPESLVSKLASIDEVTIRVPDEHDTGEGMFPAMHGETRETKVGAAARRRIGRRG